MAHKRRLNVAGPCSGCELFVYVPLTKEKFLFSDIQLSTKILELKMKFELVTGIPSLLQRLFYLDREDIKDNCDLRSIDIVTSATLNLHIWRSWEKIVYNSFIGDVIAILKLKENSLSFINNDQSIDNGSERLNVALFIAANKGRKVLVEMLLKEGASVNWQTCSGRTPLHAAAACGRSDCIEVLLENGALADQVDSFGKTASKVANEHGFRESEKQLFLFQWQKRAKNLNLEKQPSDLMMHQQFDSGYVTWLKGKHQQIYMSKTLPAGEFVGTGINAPRAKMLGSVPKAIEEKEPINNKIENELKEDYSGICTLPRMVETQMLTTSRKQSFKKTFEDWLLEKNSIMKIRVSQHGYANTECRREIKEGEKKTGSRTFYVRQQDKLKAAKQDLLVDEKPRKKIDVYASQGSHGGFEKEFLDMEFSSKMPLNH